MGVVTRSNPTLRTDFLAIQQDTHSDSDEVAGQCIIPRLGEIGGVHFLDSNLLAIRCKIAERRPIRIDRWRERGAIKVVDLIVVGWTRLAGFMP